MRVFVILYEMLSVMNIGPFLAVAGSVFIILKPFQRIFDSALNIYAHYCSIYTYPKIRTLQAVYKLFKTLNFILVSTSQQISQIQLSFLK